MKWLITGGAGFIGCNAAARLLRDGHRVLVVDDLSRAGAQANLEWLMSQGRPEFAKVDVRDRRALTETFRAHADSDVVLHLAAQVAVTTSVADPRTDFEVNALGTFNVCEAVREQAPDAILIYASTNKVYGEMTESRVVEGGGGYQYLDLAHGVPETYPLDFHSPYGCSKGAADQYTRDYARVYGLRTVVLRQSCIYGPRQFGIEDQGWVAWFTIAATLGRPVTIYGDGKQVRDVLFVDDLVDCYLAAVANIDRARSRAYNIGGGPDNVISVLEVAARLEANLGQRIERSFASWRPGDQRIFVSDIRLAQRDLGWSPRVGKEEGLRRLAHWVRDNRLLFA